MSDHTIEPGDVIRFNPGTEYANRVLEVDRVDGERIMVGSILKWFSIADVRLRAKGIANLPKTIDDGIDIAEQVREDLWRDGEREMAHGASIVVDAL